jgi:hypothetical protein
VDSVGGDAVDRVSNFEVASSPPPPPLLRSQGMLPACLGTARKPGDDRNLPDWRGS